MCGIMVVLTRKMAKILILQIMPLNILCIAVKSVILHS